MRLGQRTNTKKYFPISPLFASPSNVKTTTETLPDGDINEHASLDLFFKKLSNKNSDFKILLFLILTHLFLKRK